MKTHEEFSQRLRATLRERRMTKAELARTMRLSYSSVDRWFSGSLPHTKTLTELAMCLGVSEQWLRTGEERRGKAERPAVINGDVVEYAVPARPFTRDNPARPLTPPPAGHPRQMGLPGMPVAVMNALEMMVEFLTAVEVKRVSDHLYSAASASNDPDTMDQTLAIIAFLHRLKPPKP